MSFIVPPKARSWVSVTAGSDFPIQNLPFGAFVDKKGRMGVGVAIGDQILILNVLASDEVIGLDEEVASVEDLLEFYPNISDLREEVFNLLRDGNPNLRDNKSLRQNALVAQSEVEMLLPMHISAFVDFYSGINHASNVGRMFRPDMPPLLPNYKWLPVGYNGRASSVVPSGVEIVRPNGQVKAADSEEPTFGPTKELDFELEMGFFIGKASEAGEPVPIEAVGDHMLGMVIVNDWSARDAQRWEYQPLGPFLAKSFATSISSWIVTFDALEPFRVAGQAQDPAPLPHLKPSRNDQFDIQLEVLLRSSRMKQAQSICRTNARELYWSMDQQLAHQTSNGTPIEIGDLYASGTISGTEPGTFGSLLELTWRGQNPIHLDESGETRTFLEDGDVLTMRAWCERGDLRIGFGEVSAEIIAAP